MLKKCIQIFDEFLQIIHENIVGEDKTIIGLLNTLGIEQANDLISSAFIKYFEFMKLQEWPRYPLDRISTDIVDEQEENVIHKCVRYDKIDFLSHLTSIGFSFKTQNNQGIHLFILLIGN